MTYLSKSQPKTILSGLSRRQWIESLREEIYNLPYVSSAYFFGSFARNEETPWSDVDLAIIVKDEPSDSLIYNPKNFWSNLERVSEALGNFKDIDLIVYTESQWENWMKEPNPQGFWKDLKRDLVPV